MADNLPDLRHLLYPETPVEQCNLSHGATLHLTSILQGGKRVRVKLLTPEAPGITCGPTVNVELEPDTPMYEVKLQLQEATGIPVDAQKVMLAGIGDMVLGDKRTNIGYTYCGSTSNFGLATMGQPA
ncbi:hypothetical protein DUNSADRAFT_6697 [Dunaliella salina]|uniref:Ubiquitin-like domain-containing protein n=1 Tax=Dunaliella salina TaxID=3046 RepID=A0ABQ7GMQ0_DUNSA|nr:hypothetical protein DUNSADRAFT_6697 [Dunaliella salina]|eukprot:KAF5835884.1 hypothetical protein DUNSADRAFT_6697 [Dunaliella salina]